MARVTFVVRDFSAGGAERQLALLAAGLSSSGHDVSIVVFRFQGSYGTSLLSGSRVRVFSLDKQGLADTVGFLLRAARLARSLRPDVIHGYMDAGNLIASWMSSFTTRCVVVWGLRLSEGDLRSTDYLGRLVRTILRLLSRTADVIISNSTAGAETFARGRRRGPRIVVIPNGVDTAAFQPDHDGRLRVRNEWGVAHDTEVIGLVARLHRMKDHRTFVAAARELARRRSNVAFVCVGEGDEPYASTIVSLFREAQQDCRLIYTGFRSDMPAVNSAFDVATSSSAAGEGFSNSLAEAMACGVPCVATDVGDARVVLGSTGIIVPRQNPMALADAWERMLDRRSVDISAACRDRILTHFGLDRLVGETVTTLGLATTAT